MCRVFLIIAALLVLALGGCASSDLLDIETTAEETETQGVDVPGVPTLTVNHFAGDIDVRTGEDGHITANLTRRSTLPNADEARGQLDNIDMSFTQSGTTVSLNIEGPDTAIGRINTPSADLELLVPPGTTLDLNLGAGDITVENPEGDVTVNSGAGNSTVTLPADASFRLQVTGGAVNVSSEFEGVPAGGVATDIDSTVGDNPTQTLAFNLGAGDVRLQQSD